MLPHIFNKLVCPYCKKSFTHYQETGDSIGIVSCPCGSYPVLDKILYLKGDNYRKKSISFLKKGDKKRALLALLDLRFIYKIIVFPFAAVKIGNEFLFKILIKFLRGFSYSKRWSWYLINRRSIPSYFLSILALEIVNNKQALIVDLGCGAGHLLKDLSHKFRTKRIIGLDKSFFNLYLARSFFADRDTYLVCAELDEGFPFKNSSVSFFLSTDTFHYFSNKLDFLNEVFRALNERGTIAVVHTLATRTRNIVGEDPSKVKGLFEKAGFGTISIYSNATLWLRIFGDEEINLDKSDDKNSLKQSYAFNVFASKGKLKKGVRFPKGKKSLLSSANYKQDPVLLNRFKLKSLFQEYANFIFLSPHLDDAVLSCGLLVDLLKDQNKRIKIVTFFTKAAKKPYTMTAKTYLKKCGYKDADKLFRDRKREDLEALSLLGADYKHYSFVDAAWRKDASGKHIYKDSSSQFAGKVSAKDRKLVKDVFGKMETLAGENTVFFAPLGVGGHVDHVIVRKAALKLETPAIFWEDFPYNISKASLDKLYNAHKFEYYFSIGSGFETKLQAIKAYRSQIDSLFPSGKIPKIAERFFISRD